MGTEYTAQGILLRVLWDLNGKEIKKEGMYAYT